MFNEKLNGKNASVCLDILFFEILFVFFFFAESKIN